MDFEILKELMKINQNLESVNRKLTAIFIIVAGIFLTFVTYIAI